MAKFNTSATQACPTTTAQRKLHPEVISHPALLIQMSAQGCCEGGGRRRPIPQILDSSYRIFEKNFHEYVKPINYQFELCIDT